MTSSKRPAATRARFVCSICGAMAGFVEIRRAGARIGVEAGIEQTIYEPEASLIQVASPAGTDVSPASLWAKKFDAIVDGVRNSDAAALYHLSYVLAPFYCPDCDRIYCDRHWDLQHYDDEKMGFSGIEGTCPNGHFHVLSM
jgi:hypothetical protein